MNQHSRQLVERMRMRRIVELYDLLDWQETPLPHRPTLTLITQPLPLLAGGGCREVVAKPGGPISPIFPATGLTRLCFQPRVWVTSTSRTWRIK